MASIDERVVSMAFENAKFEAGVATTMATLAKLDHTIKNIGTTNGLANIETSASKVTLSGPMSALDKLKQKIGLVSQGSPEAFNAVERAGDRMPLTGPQTALDKLQQKIGLVGKDAPVAFGDIEKASSRVTLSGITNAMDKVQAKFSLIEGAAAVAFGNIASKAAIAGAGAVKSFSLGPITQGFDEYSTNLKSIQTILANTKASGADLDDVNKALKELNDYSDKTIYNFSQMADSIGLFTAAGVDLKTSVSSIKGLANLAALSGSGNEKATHAMQQLSQAVAAGKVTMQDWISVRNAGMGGTVFQRALAQTAEGMGTIKKGTLDLEGPMKNVKIAGESFADSIRSKPGEESWLTSTVLTETLKQFTGDLSDADLAAKGFSQSQIDSIQETARAAKNAAQEVKTIKEVFDVAKETMGSGWSQTFQLIFGDFTEAKKTFTDLSNAINSVINRMSDARNKVLGEWKELGGRTMAIQALKNVFTVLGDVLSKVGQAFREVFPATTGKQLADLTEKFLVFTAHLNNSPEIIDNIARTFKGFFALLHIGWTIVKEVGEVIFDLLGVVGKGSGGFLNFTGSIGDFLVALDQALTKGGLLSGLFDGLTAVIKVPLQLLGLLSTAIFNLFNGGDGQKAEELGAGFDRIAEAAGPLKKVIDFLSDAWDRFVGVLDKVKQAVEPWLSQVASAFSAFGNMVADQFNNINWDTAFAAIQTGLIGGLFVTIKKAIGKGIGIDVGGGMLENLSNIFKALTGNLQAMQQNLQAGTLLKIAAAIGVLAAAILLLSQIDPAKLQKAMTAVAVGLGQLVAALAILAKVAKGGAFLTLPLLAGAMVALSIAVLILAGALKIMATMKWEEIAKGLTAVGGVLAAVGVGTRLIGPQIVIAALAMIPLAIALNILALAVKQFGSMDLPTLGKGLGGVAVALLLIAGAMQLMPPTMLVTAAGLVVVGIGLNAVAAAVAAFGSLELKTMVQGLLGIAGALIAIGMSVALIPPTLPLTAAGLILLGIALTSISASVALMGKLKIGTLVKGIAALAAVLVVLAVGLTAMSGTLPGSIALLAAAAALAILAPTLAILGNLEWSTIFKGLAAIALTLGVLAVVGLLAAPTLVALGVAMVPLGLGMAAVAAAAYLFAKALQVLGADGLKATATVIAALTALAIAIPKIILTFIQGVVGIAGSVAEIAPKVLQAIGVMIDMIIAFVIESAPKLAVAIGVLVEQFAKVIFENLPTLVATGFQMLLTFLGGIANNIGKVTEQAAQIILKFLGELTRQAPALVASGLGLLVQFLKGIGNNLYKVLNAAFDVVGKFLTGITERMPDIIEKGAKLILTFLAEITKKVPRFITAGLNIILAFIKGIADNLDDVVDAGVNLISKLIRAVSNGALKLVNEGANALIKFLHGFATAIRTKGPELRAAGWDVADALIDGLIDGLSDLADHAIDAVTGIFKKLPGAAKKVLGISSPSKVFAEIGRFTMAGMVEGLTEGGDEAVTSVERMTSNVIRAAEDSLMKVPDMLDGIMDMDPVITPVLDLSAVEREATKLGDLTATTPIAATVSSDTAAAVAGETQASQEASAAAAGATKVELNQYNSSPKALDEVEIYRQTNNQLSQVKSALGVTV